MGSVGWIWLREGAVWSYPGHLWGTSSCMSYNTRKTGFGGVNHQIKTFLSRNWWAVCSGAVQRRRETHAKKQSLNLIQRIFVVHLNCAILLPDDQWQDLREWYEAVSGKVYLGYQETVLHPEHGWAPEPAPQGKWSQHQAWHRFESMSSGSGSFVKQRDRFRGFQIITACQSASLGTQRVKSCIWWFWIKSMETRQLNPSFPLPILLRVRAKCHTMVWAE